MRKRLGILALPAAMLALASPAFGQDLEQLAGAAGGETAFDGDWLSFGLGVGLNPSYEGSDDYNFIPVPLIQGEVAGIGINPRPAGLAFDIVPDPDEGAGFSFGPSIRLRASRAQSINDPVVESVGELDRAIEIGPSAGIAVPKVLHEYDSISLSLDARWDIAGAHEGFVLAPSITYFTPLSRGAAVSLTVDAEHGDDRFMEYYYSVTPEDALASGLSPFQAQGGFTRAGALLIAGLDFNGDLADGGLALFAIGSYSRMLGDAKASPFTSERGSADQWLGALGLGYTF